MAVPAIVVNLDRSPDRLAHIRREFARIGMTFERLSAVDRTALPESVKPYFCNAAGTIVSPLGPGEIGCYASHLVLWQLVAAGHYGAAVLVCEDDMVLPDGFDRLVSELPSRAPQGWDFINLSGRTKRAVVPLCRVTDRCWLVRFSRDPGSTAAYLISREGARKMLRAGLRRRPVDQDLRRPWAFGTNTFGVWPPVPEASIGSTIEATPAGLRLMRQYQRSAPLDVLRRPVHGIRTLGLASWAECAAWNLVGRKLQWRAPQHYAAGES